MRLETVPLVIGVLIALLGAGIVFDAWTPDAIVVPHERRRRPRVERHRGGEALIGFGVIGVAAEFLGRDNWNYSTYAVIAGVVLLVWGAVLEWPFVAASFSNRGPLRRRESGEGRLPAAAPPPRVSSDDGLHASPRSGDDDPGRPPER